MSGKNITAVRRRGGRTEAAAASSNNVEQTAEESCNRATRSGPDKLRHVTVILQLAWYLPILGYNPEIYTDFDITRPV